MVISDAEELSGQKRTFWPVIKTGPVQKIKIQSHSPVTTTHYHISGHCHVFDRLILSFSPSNRLLSSFFFFSSFFSPVLSTLRVNSLCNSEIWWKVMAFFFISTHPPTEPCGQVLMFCNFSSLSTYNGVYIYRSFLVRLW